MASEKDLLRSVLVELYKISPESVSESLYTKSEEGGEEVLREDAFQVFKTFDSKRVNGWKETAEKKRAADVGEVISKERSKAESAIKQVFGDDLEGDLSQMLESLKQRTSKTGKGSPEEITKHPDFIKLQDELVKWQKRYETDIDSLKKGLEAEKTQFVWELEVSDMGMQDLLAMQPILEGAESVRKHRLGGFKKELTSRYKWQRNPENGEYVPFVGNERATDEHGNYLTRADIVKRLAQEQFEFPKQEQKGQPGNANGNGAASGASGLKTINDYEAAMSRAMGTPEFAEIAAQYAKFKEANPA